MSFYRTQNRTVLAKVESTSGTDASPVVGTNAVLVESPQTNPNLSTTETREVSGALDKRAPIPNGGDRGFTGKVYCKGSGSPGTTLPEVDPLLKGCALSPTALAADVTGTAQAGATSTITLAAGASAVDNFYQGQVIEITGGTGAGQKRIIASYVGSTKVATVSPSWTTALNGVAGTTPDATSVYAIRKCHVYVPISASVPTLTIYDYAHRSDGGNSKLKKVLGAAGNGRLTLAPRAIPYWEFDFKGQLVADSDVSAPSAATYQSNRPVAFMGAQVALGNTQLQLNSLTLDLGNNPVTEDDPNATFGTGIAGIVERGIGGSMVVNKELESVRNIFSSWQNGTAFTYTAIWGGAIGNRIALLLTNVIYTGLGDQDVQGFNYDNIPFRLDATNSGLWLTYW